MPIYRYLCQKCKTEFKELHQNGDGESISCPGCGNESVKRLLPRIGVIYKGNGYYSTDYKGKSKQTGNSNKKDSDKAEE